MSHLTNLIEASCPEGVVFREMWEVTTWDKKFNAVDRRKQPHVRKYTYLLASEMKSLVVDGGDVKLLTTNTSDLWTTSALAGEQASEGEIVCIPWGGNPNVQYFNGKFVTADNRIAVVNDPNELNTKFLYYVMLSQLDLIGSFYRGSGIAHPSMAKVLDLRIPVPPLEVQMEIVSILDSFSEFEAELVAELEARREQYAHYSAQLLGGSHANPTRVALGDALELVIDHRGKTPKKLGGDWSTSGHRVVSALNMKNGVVDDNDHHYIDDDLYAKWMRIPLQIGDVLLTSEAPLGAVAFVGAPVDWAIGQRVFGLRPKPDVLDGRFLYHQLRAGEARADLFSRATGSTVSGVRQSELVKVMLDLPELAEQRRIADVLDTFDALVNSLTEGLPAELQARRQQYEYYRDKLLAFEEAAA